MNILLISDEFPPIGGGAGVVAKQNITKLKSLGHNIALLTRYQSSLENDLKDISLFSVKKIPKLSFLSYKFMLYRMNLKDYDVIILNDMYSGFIAGRYFSKEILNKCIYFLHGSEPEVLLKKESLKNKLIQFNLHYETMIKHCNVIIAVSKYMKQKFSEKLNYQEHILDKIKVDYTGIEMKEYDESKCQNSDKIILLTVSRIVKGKGFIEMYDVYKKIIIENNTFIWVIVGEGDYREEFEKIIREDHLEEYIQFEGYKNKEELYNYYKCADLFWLLSNFRESFGLVYLEAQYFGCPVIGYNRYGVKESVLNNKTGFLVENPLDTLRLIIDKKYTILLKSDMIEFAVSFQSNINSIIEDVHSHNLGEKEF